MSVYWQFPGKTRIIAALGFVMRSLLFSMGYAWLLLCASVLLGDGAIAQPIPDDSLGEESSTLNRSLVNGLPAEVVEGGARRSQNLFHSFQDFSVEAGSRVYFSNPSEIENIFSRVSGRTPSQIDGTLGVAGSANLYFLNPNGIVFGADANLDILGSFFATTAEELKFADGYEYKATPAYGSEVLTVSIPIGLQTNTLPQQGHIENAGNLLLTRQQSVALIGHTLNYSGSITVPEGNIVLLAEEIAVTNNARLDVSGESGQGTILIGGDFQGQGNLPTASETVVSSGATLSADATVRGNGGRIVVWSDGATYFAGRASAQGGPQGGDGGLVEVSGVEKLAYRGQVDTRAAAGEIGTLLLDPTNIEIVAAVDADTFDPENVDELSDPDLSDGVTRIAADALALAFANVQLQATQDITFNANVTTLFPGVGLAAEAGNDIVLNRFVQASGGGDLRFTAGNDITFNGVDAYAYTFGGNAELEAGGVVSLLDGAQVDTAPFFGDSGNLDVTAQRLTMTGGAQLIAGSFSGGTSGTLTVKAEDVQLSGFGVSQSGEGATGLVGFSRDTFADGTNGIISVEADRVAISDGATIGSPSNNSQSGGSVTVIGRESIQISGFKPSGTDTETGEFRSGIFTSSFANGDAGTVDLRTNNLTIEGGAQVGSSALGFGGQAGTVTIKAPQVEIAGGAFPDIPGGLFARSFTAGDAGTVSLTEGADVLLREGAVIDTSSALSEGGSVNINTRNLTLREGSTIDNTTILGSRSGAVDIAATDNFTLESNSSVSGRTLGVDGQGSSFVIRTGQLTVSNDSTIANESLESGRSGSISIFATESVNVINGGSISTGSAVGTGDGGPLTIQAPSVLVDRGSITANSSGEGGAGSVVLTGLQNLTVRNQGEVSARGIFETSGSGDVLVNAQTILLEDGGKIIVAAPSSNGGNIDLTANQYVLLRRGSFISAEAGTEDASELLNPIAQLGSGGNVRIQSPFVIALPNENSDISANAFIGEGGRVDITATGIFGLEFREARSPASDITASSEFGANGIVELNVLDTSFIQNDVAALPDAPVDTNQLIAGSCIARDAEGTFVVSGADGLQQQPGREGTAIFSTGEVRGPREELTTEEPVWEKGDPVLEASDVYELTRGRAILSHDCSQ